ncbi:MAG: ribonucleoside hydrolase RihC, partial [Leuconostoc mesenteroides]
YKLEDLWVDVVTDGPAIGATVADILHSTHSQTNVHVAKDIDVPAFNAWYLLQISGISDGNINAGRLEN